MPQPEDGHPLQCGFNGWPACPPVQSVVTTEGRTLRITGATMIEDITDGDPPQKAGFFHELGHEIAEVAGEIVGGAAVKDE